MKKVRRKQSERVGRDGDIEKNYYKTEGKGEGKGEEETEGGTEK